MRTNLPSVTILTGVCDVGHNGVAPILRACETARQSNLGVSFDCRRLQKITVQEDAVIDALYDLIGGKQAIWAATESFYKRVLADDSLRQFFKRTDMAHLQSRQSMFLSMLLGGRVVYTGKDIHEAHVWARNHGLSDANYDAFLHHFRAALEEVGVNSEKAAKVIELLETRRDAVLNP